MTLVLHLGNKTCLTMVEQVGTVLCLLIRNIHINNFRLDFTKNIPKVSPKMKLCKGPLLSTHCETFSFSPVHINITETKALNLSKYIYTE